MSKTFESAKSPDTSAGAFDSRRMRCARCLLANVESERRELARRSVAGIDVTLYWHPTLDEVIVCVCDERDGTHFEIRPQRDLALDVYHHPYAYADLADVHERRTGVPPRDDDLKRSSAERIRGRIDRLGEPDMASQDVPIEVVRAVEQQPWMLRLQPPAEGRQ